MFVGPRWSLLIRQCLWGESDSAAQGIVGRRGHTSLSPAAEREPSTNVIRLSAGTAPCAYAIRLAQSQLCSATRRSHDGGPRSVSKVPSAPTCAFNVARGDAFPNSPTRIAPVFVAHHCTAYGYSDYQDCQCRFTCSVTFPTNYGTASKYAPRWTLRQCGKYCSTHWSNTQRI